jgi:glycogen operon protein
MIIYECHIDGFSKLNNNIPEFKRGKFLGLCDEWTIRHLKSLNVDVVQIMPIFKNLNTYWGYDPVSWTEHNEKYGTLQELKQMISALHDNGIKVVLDVVYNHIHGDHKGVVKGDKAFSGCGDDVRVDLSLPAIKESIDYWMSIFDGMRFDLAPVLFREGNYFNPGGEFAKYIKTHADNGKIIVVEPWDLGCFVDYGKYGGYFVGQFPSFCLEHNDKIRDAVRQGKTYYCGSNYKKHIGFATVHDGFNLTDLVSYNQKHNERNGENNRDGSDCNYSNNHGTEGLTDNKCIIKARLNTKKQIIKNLITSAYHIMIFMGDEMGHTQNGNNNNYLHENHLNWDDLEKNRDWFDFYCDALKK